MENNTKRNTEENRETQFTQSPGRNPEQQAINAIDAASTDMIGDKMLDKLLESARVKRRSVLARKQASQADDHRGNDETDRSSVTPFITPGAGKASPRLAPVVAKPPKVEAPLPVSATPAPPVETVQPATDTPRSYKSHAPVIAMGALVVGVVLVNSWYLGSRIEANTQRLTVGVGEQPAPATIAPTDSGELVGVLALARDAFNTGLLTEPAGESALDLYRTALRLDPDNAAAQAGIRAITDQLLLRAEAALQAQRLEEATAALQAVRGIDAELPLLSLLEAQIARQQSSLADAAKVPPVTDKVIPPPVENTSEPAAKTQSASSVAQEGKETTDVAMVAGPGSVEQSATQTAPLKKQAENTVADVPTAKAEAALSPQKEELTENVDRAVATTPATTVSEPTPQPITAPITQIPETPETAVGEVALANSEQIDAEDESLVSDKPVSLTRVKWVQPVTPSAAIRRGLSGWVEVAFIVTPEGETSDVTVADSSPRRIFDKAAIAAVRQWRFEPPMRDGEPVSQPTTVRFKFVAPD